MNKWFKGLGNAALNGAVGVLLPVVYNWAQATASGQPTQFPSGETLGLTGLAAAILGVCNYLVKSPQQSSDSQK